LHSEGGEAAEAEQAATTDCAKCDVKAIVLNSLIRLLKFFLLNNPKHFPYLEFLCSTELRRY
jgi:hypothetical protein